MIGSENWHDEANLGLPIRIVRSCHHYDKEDNSLKQEPICDSCFIKFKPKYYCIAYIIYKRLLKEQEEEREEENRIQKKKKVNRTPPMNNKHP